MATRQSDQNPMVRVETPPSHMIRETAPPNSKPAATGRTYDASVRVPNPTGEPTESTTEHRKFVDPNPGGMLGKDWENASK